MANNEKKQLTGNQVCLITGIIVAVAIGLIVFLTLSSMGPITRLERAARKTLLSNTFSAQFSMNVNAEPVEGMMDIAIIPSEKALYMYMQLSNHAADYVCGFYDGYFVVASPSDGTSQVTDIYARQEAFFQALEKTGTPDWSILLDLEEVDLYDEICKSFDFDILMTCLSQWLEQMDSKSWAKKNAGYQKTRVDGVTVHSFTPKPYDLVNQSLPYFEDAFLRAEDLNDLQEYTENAKYLFQNGQTDFSFGIKGGNLVSMEFALKYNKTDISGNIQIEDIGSAKVDIGNVAYYVEEYKQQGNPMADEMLTEIPA